MQETVVINLLGGSGLGKSTTAALIFGELKLRGKETELVREFVKEWAWQGKPVGRFGQGTLYGHQIERESSLYNKVDYVVTDSPLLLCPIYQLHYGGHDAIKHQVFADLNTAKEMNVTHLNFLLTRKKAFNPKGRYETEDQAKVIDKKVEAFLVSHGIPYILVDVSDADRVKFITDYAITFFEKKTGESNVTR